MVRSVREKLNNNNNNNNNYVSSFDGGLFI